MNVYVLVGEDLCSVDGSKNLRPFVSARVFGMVQTTKVQKGLKCAFKAKMSFPVYYPILNNKITIRLWHETGGLYRNTFLANIPELPD